MRGKRAPKRKIDPDPKYNNLIIAKFVNAIMQRGKKTVAQGIVYDAFEVISKKTKQDPMDIFDRALKNISPMVEIRGRRVGGANYQIPYQVRGERKQTLAFRWLITASKARKGKPMYQKLAQELIDAADNQGAAVKKKQDVHRMAEANRAFAHFAR